MTSVVGTLFEGGYHYGLAALVNSLYANGYRGTVFVGHRGPLPPWATGGTRVGDAIDWRAADGLILRFISVSTTIHLTNYKAKFLLDLWEEQCPKATQLFYFDPDIVIMCRWGFFEEWVEAGIAVCQDVNGSMPNNHPVRHAWRTRLASHGFALTNPSEIYLNGGFLGLKREEKNFLELWQSVLNIIDASGVGLKSLKVGDRSLPYTLPDQDALNIACMATNHSVSPMGSDGMDFQWGGGGYVMSHAVGPAKPWNHCYSLRALRGHRVGRPTIQFLQNLMGPIKPYSNRELLLKRLDVGVAKALGRLTT